MRGVADLQSLPQRFWDKIMPCPNTGCWIWIGARSSNGYGNTFLNDRYKVAHRAVYELMVGAVDPLLELDHLCKNRPCVNPLHLEPVTGRENMLRGMAPPAMQARQTHCKRGHPLTGEHLYIERTERGEKRHCYTCMKARDSKRNRPLEKLRSRAA